MIAKNGSDLRPERGQGPPILSGSAASAGPAPYAAPASHGSRSARISLLAISLGSAGLGGAWQAATSVASAWIQISDVLFVISGLVWVVLLAAYVRHGGARWRNLREDLRHPGQGFALAYVPIIGMLITGHFSRFGEEGARWAYAVFVVAAALVAARLLAHWFTGGLGDLVAFMLPTLRERSFHTGLWIYSFPVAATTNFLVRWTSAAEVPGRETVVWTLLAVASGGFLLLGVATLVHGGRHWRLRTGRPELG
ncbi:C4-dicarboxylate transporter/malic acid transporter [Streptomyces violaceusniger]|uniref:C4-dicarboxylate transporter/malic acid transport protein n=1 Tax=Streptomyces violaceusniger (strain Tu 4113) TaxID=653045 RepID=G2PG97_STRV4|nr:C4-dicarboxylate transporter/malic acid transporter [Streptomyces violaceusniger]AEM85476.1 C4-dicarboxylate transporter/malic acid transport protein [Streptomyces violaceusniger Tu 4113]